MFSASIARKRNSVTVWALPRSTLVRVGIACVRSSIYVAHPTSDSQFSAVLPLSSHRYKLSFFNRHNNEPQITRQRPGFATVAMGRLVIYERLPRCIRRHEMAIYSQRNGEVPHQKLTVVLKTVPMAMLSTCRQINSEASAIMQGIARRLILLQPPQLIFEAQDHFNETFLFWILDAISEQAHRRVLGSIRHTLDRTGDGRF
jgi:hypothetical protein